MPDKRRHRGSHPEDQGLFHGAQHVRLRTAVSEYAWLLTHGYATASALKLVGDRHELTARQRMAVRRSTCSDQALQRRAERMISLSEVSGRPLAIDGYNLLITIESALAGGLVLIGRDGCCRDLASVHGTYRKVEETTRAVRLIADRLAAGGISQIDWYLDKPVSNSGRLKALIEDVVAGTARPTTRDCTWRVTLEDSPDAVLRACADPVVTTDSAILDHGVSWVNLAAEIIGASVPEAWMLDLRSTPDVA